MATKEARSATNKKADDFRLNCDLCMDTYSKVRIPKMLPCFHTFCVICLNALVGNVDKPDETQKEDTKGKAETQESQMDEETELSEESFVQETPDDDKKIDKDKEEVEGKPEVEGDGENGVVGNNSNVFLCPSCRAPVTVPTGGVAAIQTNFYLDLDLGGTGDLSSSDIAVPCEMCEEGQDNEATHFCNNCQQRMCRSCRRLHDLVTGAREHRVEPIAAGYSTNAATSAEGKKYCQYHSDQMLSFHCQKCDVSICLHCKLTSHEGHSTEDMATAAIRAKEELTGVLTKARKHLRVVQASISRLERDMLDLTRQKQDVTRQLKANYDVIMAWVTRASEEARESLEAKEQTALNEIHSEQASAHNIKETISGLVSRAMASHKASLGPDLVLLKNELQAALLRDDSFDHYDKLGSRKQPRTFLECRPDPSALDLDLVRVYLGELLEEGEAGTQYSALSLRELAALVPKLEAEMKALNDKGQVENASFHALMTNTPAYNSGHKIVFDQVMFSQGNGYNPADGVFTAPVPGTYMFMTTVRHYNGEGYNVTAHIYVNGRACAYIASNYSFSAHCVAELKKGEQVWVQAGCNLTCQANCTMFSGALVSK